MSDRPRSVKVPCLVCHYWGPLLNATDIEKTTFRWSASDASAWRIGYVTGEGLSQFHNCRRPATQNLGVMQVRSLTLLSFAEAKEG